MRLGSIVKDPESEWKCILLGAAIYGIWKEGNLHKFKVNTSAQVLKYKILDIAKTYLPRGVQARTNLGATNYEELHVVES